MKQLESGLVSKKLSKNESTLLTQIQSLTIYIVYELTDIGTPIAKQHNGINEITLYYDLPLFFYFIIGLTFIGWLILFIMFIRSRIHS
ncbi:TPA: hypothetical protein ACSPFO_002422 [Enterococcus faecium]